MVKTRLEVYDMVTSHGSAIIATYMMYNHSLQEEIKAQHYM